MKSIKSVLVGLLFIAASPAFAQAKNPVATVPVKDGATAETIGVPSVLSYTFAELGYTKVDFDGRKADGFVLAGSFALPTTMLPGLYLRAAYSPIEADKVSGRTREINDIQLGAGYRMGLSSTLDLNAELDLVQRKVEDKGGTFNAPKSDDTGFSLGLGARAQLMPQLEAKGGLRHVDIGDFSETFLEAGGLYHIAHGFSAYLSAAISSDVTTYGLGGRYNFSF